MSKSTSVNNVTWHWQRESSDRDTDMISILNMISIIKMVSKSMSTMSPGTGRERRQRGTPGRLSGQNWLQTFWSKLNKSFDGSGYKYTFIKYILLKYLVTDQIQDFLVICLTCYDLVWVTIFNFPASYTQHISYKCHFNNNKKHQNTLFQN